MLCTLYLFHSHHINDMYYIIIAHRKVPALPPHCMFQSHNVEQCSKLRNFSMHTPGAQIDKTMHPAILKYMHPTAKMCTQGAGCTLNFEHWVLKQLYHSFKSPRLYPFTYLPLCTENPMAWAYTYNYMYKRIQ